MKKRIYISVLYIIAGLALVLCALPMFIKWIITGDSFNVKEYFNDIKKDIK